MDLRERDGAGRSRHPWETARVAALKEILDLIPHRKQAFSVLDVGSGDGFSADALLKGKRVSMLASVDTAFTCDDLMNGGARSARFSALEEVPAGAYDVVLLLDVLEHLDDSPAFLRRLVESRFHSDTWGVVTVPAHRALFSAHDRFLAHRRRYSRNGLRSELESSGLRVRQSGYLFSSLLPLRTLQVIRERLGRGPKSDPKGVGGWRGGPFLSEVLALLLHLENRGLIHLSAKNLHVPGLSIWMLTQKL